MVHLTDLRAKIRDIPDFPQKGVVFKDITPLLRDPDTFRAAVDGLAQPFRGAGVDAVVAIEARGYILGAPVAAALGAGFVPVRKVGKLPWQTYRTEYSLEYGAAVVEMHQDALYPGQRVVIIDDVLATGGTLAATIRLVEQAGARVAGLGVLIELDFLDGRRLLEPHALHSLIHF